MNRRAAFTLVEILAAMAFLGLVIPVVLGALLISNRAAVTAERSSVAAQLAENEMAQLMIDDAWTSASSRGDFGENWPGYRWELKKNSWEATAMTELDLTVFFQVHGRDHQIVLSTLASEDLAAEEAP
jgi:type II secretory pathway pseudopilin PulG